VIYRTRYSAAGVMTFGLQERLVYDSVDRASKPLRILIADDP